MRVFLEILAIFAAPFIIFLLYRAIRADSEEAEDARRLRPYLLLGLAGLMLVAAYFIVGRLIEPRTSGVYVPAEIRDGQLVPSRVD